MFKHMKQRVECEVYSRVTGYLRPVKQWNDAKRQEFVDRKLYKIPYDNNTKDIRER